MLSSAFLSVLVLTTVNTFAFGETAHAASPANVVPADSPALLNGVKNSLTLYVYPPRNPIDWSTPKSTLKTTLANIISLTLSMNHDVQFESEFNEQGSISSHYKSSMGHTLAHIRCTLADGEAVDRWASLSGEDYPAEDKRLLLHEKIGMGALFHNYIDGYIIAGVENVRRITYYTGESDGDHGHKVRPRYIQFEVDANHCLAMKRMVEYFESFHFAPNTPYETLAKRAPEDLLYFTNQIDPYDAYRQRLLTGKGTMGGGCAPFGAALVKAGGRFQPVLDTLWRTPVTVSEKLIGGETDARTGQVRRVSISSILNTSLGDRWTYDEEGYADRSVNMYDPQKIWNFAGDMIACLDSQACPEGAGNVLGAENGRIGWGDTQLFSDTRPVSLSESNGTGDHRMITTQQPVQGFVWKLR
jgi:hypothetical protein